MKRTVSLTLSALILATGIAIWYWRSEQQIASPRGDSTRALLMVPPPVNYQHAPENESQPYANADGAGQVATGDADYMLDDAEAIEELFEIPENTESYKGIEENRFRSPFYHPLSTFSIDVDRASYSNVRRFIEQGQIPPPDAVRIEEMINYFSYEYPQPERGIPFSINTQLSTAPWNPEHKLLQVGLQGRNIPLENLPASNLVFLIDVSGSMDEPNKLPLVIESFKMLVRQLRAQDHVAIVVYAGAAGVVLEPVSGNETTKILNALDQLKAGGSTAGGEGLRLAYSLASQHWIEGGNNRVILATDGDFNVGESSDDAMERLIVQERKKGIFLTVVGYGMGNYKDSKLEVLADKGNGNYGYVDDITEARKMFVTEFGGTLFAIAKDVKIQIEFNPEKVQAYRLVGYENRLLRDEDFNDDKKDAGELGSGHTVTALYEIIPTGVKSSFFDIDSLKYSAPRKLIASDTHELLTVKLRYKQPDGDKSELVTQAIADKTTPFQASSENFRWASSVAMFGMLLRDSEFVKKGSYEEVVAIAETARGRDPEGYRAEFISLAKSLGLTTRR